jgi:hypothetical protein
MPLCHFEPPFRGFLQLNGSDNPLGGRARVEGSRGYALCPCGCRNSLHNFVLENLFVYTPCSNFDIVILNPSASVSSIGSDGQTLAFSHSDMFPLSIPNWCAISPWLSPACSRKKRSRLPILTVMFSLDTLRLSPVGFLRPIGYVRQAIEVTINAEDEIS